MNHRIEAIDLFSGCGGLSLGLSEVGIAVRAAYDNWPEALTVYRHNISSHPAIQFDLSDASGFLAQELVHGVDLVVGGPPCQDFSSAGKRDESLGRANLTRSFAEIVVGISPRWFIMENVARARNSEAVRWARNRFREHGYGLSEMVLDASLCGVPQRRKRFFMLGELGAEEGWAEEMLLSHLSSEPTTVRDHFGESLQTEHYYRHPRNYSRRGVFSIDEPSATVRGVNRPIPKGYPGHPLDSSPVNQARPLTLTERAGLQTFPKTFEWIGSKTNVEQMIGNAVPVKLAAFVARAIVSRAAMT